MPKGLLKTNEFLYESNFFVYVYHALPLTLFLKLLIRFIKPTSESQVLLIYFAVVVITIVVGLFVFALLKKVFPKFTAFITGSRS